MWLQWQSKASRCLSLSHTAVLQPWPSAPPQITAECSVKPLQALQILCSNPLTGNAQTRGSPVWPCGYWLTISLLTPLSLSPPATSSENTREGGRMSALTLLLLLARLLLFGVQTLSYGLQEGDDDMKTSLQQQLNILIYDVKEP